MYKLSFLGSFCFACQNTFYTFTKIKIMKHIKKFNKMNENLIVTSDLEYHNRGEEVSIKQYLPNFYEQNRERVDSGRIKFFYDGYATEVGCLIDLDTLETYIIDTRA